ncbi:MAG: co-chaperone GroES, partial [Gemmatimonadales bacterium]|nr:co-chaperone GroES [Gemmatimonadales bacterium]
LILVGDRVLIAPEEGEERTRVGLYLPATALDAQQVQSGLVIAVGPGDPAPDLASASDDEPWKVRDRPMRWRPMQARVGDHAIFFRKAAVEITFEEKKYLVVPQAAILALVREDLPI